MTLAKQFRPELTAHCYRIVLAGVEAVGEIRLR
jgi:hypothetical protein